MANTGWIDASNSGITFKEISNIASFGNTNFKTDELTRNGGTAYFAIYIENFLIENGTITQAKIKGRAYGDGKIGANGTLEIGFINSSGGYTFPSDLKHSKWMGNNSSSASPFEDTISKSNHGLTKTNTGQYVLVMRVTNNIALSKERYYVDSMQIYIEYDPPHTHTTEVRNATSATCTTDGYTGDTYCKTCGKEISSGTAIPALGHDYKPTLVAPPTCTDRGYTAYQCSRCGSSYTDNYVAALGHNYTTEEIAPTVSSHGCIRHTCTRCGDTYETDIKYLITVEASPPEGGTVSGGGIYDAGDSVTVSALSNTGWYTSEWLKNGEHEHGEHVGRDTFNASESLAYTIIFKKQSYSLTLNAENGTITGATNGASYEYGTSLTLKAVPDAGYKFVKWSDGVTDDTRTITITNNSYTNTYKAIFEKLPEFTSVQMLYMNQQISETNKVPVGEYFRIVVGIKE